MQGSIQLRRDYKDWMRRRNMVSAAWGWRKRLYLSGMYPAVPAVTGYGNYEGNSNASCSLMAGADAAYETPAAVYIKPVQSSAVPAVAYPVTSTGATNPVSIYAAPVRNSDCQSVICPETSVSAAAASIYADTVVNSIPAITAPSTSLETPEKSISEESGRTFSLIRKAAVRHAKAMEQNGKAVKAFLSSPARGIHIFYKDGTEETFETGRMIS